VKGLNSFPMILRVKSSSCWGLNSSCYYLSVSVEYNSCFVFLKVLNNCCYSDCLFLFLPADAMYCFVSEDCLRLILYC
jgi:hypothetical protein